MPTPPYRTWAAATLSSANRSFATTHIRGRACEQKPEPLHGPPQQQTQPCRRKQQRSNALRIGFRQPPGHSKRRQDDRAVCGDTGFRGRVGAVIALPCGQPIWLKNDYQSNYPAPACRSGACRSIPHVVEALHACMSQRRAPAARAAADVAGSAGGTDPRQCCGVVAGMTGVPLIA